MVFAMVFSFQQRLTLIIIIIFIISMTILQIVLFIIALIVEDSYIKLKIFLFSNVSQLFKMFHILVHNILGFFVSRETLYCVLKRNRVNVSRETFTLNYQTVIFYVSFYNLSQFFLSRLQVQHRMAAP